MKSRTKSTKACISIESKKSKQKLNESKITKSVSKKTEVELRANLENTLKLLQSRLKIKPENKSSTTTLNLSSAIYKIVQEHIPEKVKVSAGPTLHSFENSGSDFMKEREASKEQPKKLQQNPSSSLMDYFKDKFGSPATDVGFQYNLGINSRKEIKGSSSFEEKPRVSIKMQQSLQ